MKFKFVAFMILASFCGFSVCAEAAAQTQSAAVSEMSGEEAPAPFTTHAVVPHGSAIPPGGLLLIPDSTADRVMAFDPVTGDLINADYIPADSVHLATPIEVVLKSDRSGFLVSDQISDAVYEYDRTGAYVGLFAPAGGVDTSVLDNIRGIGFRSNGNLLVTVAAGANADAVAEFDSAGAYLGNFVANGADGLVSPFDVLARETDFLVDGITSDRVHSFDLSGAPNPDLAPIDTFPEQMASAAGGNTLVANFSGTQEGVVEFDAGGSVVGIYDPASLGGYRGVYELPNGNILTTNGGGVHEIDRQGNLVATKIAGVSGRFITYVEADTEDLIFADGFD